MPSLATVFGSGFHPVSPGPCVLIRSVACPQALRSRSTTFSSSLLRPDVPVLLPPTHYAWRLVAGSLPLGPPTAGQQDLPDVISAHLSLRAWTPTPAALAVHVPVSSRKTTAFPPLGQGRRFAMFRAATSARTLFRGCSHSLTFRPAGLLATQVAPTDADTSAWQP